MCKIIIVWILQQFHVTSCAHLFGAGASLPTEVYEAWFSAFENYRQTHIHLDTEYFATGSGKALRNAVEENEVYGGFKENQFYATDIIFTSKLKWPEDISLLPVLAG